MTKNENKSYVFFTVSKDARLNSISDQYLAIIREGLGWDIQIGSYLPDLVGRSERAYFLDQLELGYSGQCFSFEILFPCKISSSKLCEVVVTPILNENGEVQQLGLAIKCIDQFKDELARIKDQGLLSIVFNTISMGVCITDHRGIFVEVNDEYCRIYGYEREELIGQNFTLVVKPADRDALQKLHDEFFTVGKEPSGEFEVLAKSGKIKVISVSSHRLVTSDGDQFKVTTIQDVTELKTLEDQLENVSNSIPGVILRYMLKPDGSDQVLYVSEGILDFAGIQTSDAIRDINLIWENIHPESIELLRESIEDSARTLQPWRADWQYSHPIRGVRWHRGQGNPKRHLDGSVIWDSIILDVTQEKQAQLALNESQSRFEKLISDGVEMIAILDREGNYTYNSPAYLTMLGYQPEELNKIQAFSLIHPDDVPQLYSEFEQVFTQKKIHSQPYRIRRKDGQYIWLKSIGTNLLDDPQISGIVVNSTNVSDLVQIEMELKASEQQYKYLFENNPGAMMIWELATGKILDINDRTCELYGYSREELLRMTVYDVRPPEEVPKFQELSEKENWVFYEGARLYHGISRHQDKAGNLLDVEVNAQMITYKGTRVSLVLLHDVTQKLKEELRLKLLESVITNANDAVIITEAEPFAAPGPGIIYVNEAFTRMTGYTEEEVLGKNPRMLQGPKTDQKELDRLRRAMANWESCEITTINYKKNGQEFWSQFSISPVADSSGWFTHWISIQRDVTAQKLEEQKRELIAKIMSVFAEEDRFLEAMKAALKQLVVFQSLDAGEVWLANADHSKVNLVSRFANSEVGSRFISQSQNIQSFHAGEGLPGKIWKENRSIVVEVDSELGDYPRKDLVAKSGLRVAFGFPIHYNQEVIGVVLFGTSSTQADIKSILSAYEPMGAMLGAEIHRKKVQDELLQVFNTAQDIICITGFDGKFKKINKGAVNLLGYSEEELMAKRFDFFLHPEDRKQSEDALKKISSGQNMIHYVDRYITKEGKVVWLDWNSTVVPEEELIYSVAKNITEKKELENLLENANQMARIGFWDVNMLTGTQYWSTVTKEIFELEGLEVPSVEEGIAFYMPEDVPVISHYFNECATHGTPYDLELTVTTAKGKKVWVRTIGQAEFREGVCRRVYGSIQDITLLKEAQLDLEKALEQKNAILESIGDAFFSVDPSGTITYWNQVASNLFGGTKEERIGSTIQSVISLLGENISLSKISEAIESNQVLRFEHFLRKLEKWFEISIYPSEIGLSVYLKDITIRKTSEELIRQSNERFERVAEVTADAIWDWDIRRDKLYWGRGFQQLFGLDYDSETISYKTWESHVHPDDLPKTQAYLDDSIEDIHTTNVYNEYRFRKKDGSFAFVTDRALIIRDKNGSPIRIVGAISDNTERKQYEISLRQLNEKLENRARELAISNAELEQFAYVASHDLQEPLRMVSSFLSQLEVKYGDKLDDKARRYIYFAVDGAKRMRQIILDLLDFSRVGRFQEEPISFPLSGIVEEIRILQRNLIESKKAEVIAHDLPILTSYRTPVLQVFQNLISNGLKYSKTDIPPQIQITCQEQKDFWKFEIKDNGIGMEADSFEKIFVIFQRLHTQDQYGGSGIGLAIVKKIITNLGGKIWVESELGKGTSFHFTLPKNPKKNAKDLIG